MDFKTKKFWVFIGLAVIALVGMVLGKLEFMAGLEWIVAIAGAWGLLDSIVTVATKKKEGNRGTPHYYCVDSPPMEGENKT